MLNAMAYTTFKLHKSEYEYRLRAPVQAKLLVLYQ